MLLTKGKNVWMKSNFFNNSMLVQTFYCHKFNNYLLFCQHCVNRNCEMFYWIIYMSHRINQKGNFCVSKLLNVKSFCIAGSFQNYQRNWRWFIHQNLRNRSKAFTITVKWSTYSVAKRLVFHRTFIHLRHLT